MEFETDCKPVADALSLPTTQNSELGDIISQCKSLIANNSDYVVLFVRRQANKVAHSIAKASLSNPSPYVCHDVPFNLYSLIMNEMN